MLNYSSSNILSNSLADNYPERKKNYWKFLQDRSEDQNVPGVNANVGNTFEILPQ